MKPSTYSWQGLSWQEIVGALIARVITHALVIFVLWYWLIRPITVRLDAILERLQ